MKESALTFDDIVLAIRYYHASGHGLFPEDQKKAREIIALLPEDDMLCVDELLILKWSEIENKDLMERFEKIKEACEE